jgi:hypothetical protein
VKLQKEEADKFLWVNIAEAKKLDLIDGIYDELVMTENLIKGRRTEWKKSR